MSAAPLHWLIGLLFGGYALSFALVAAALRYSHRRGLLDQPGQRRSHSAATPRGGGIGVVLAWLVGLLALAASGRIGALHASALAVALLAVAGIGWLDDHRPQRVSLRLVVQAVGCVVLALGVLGLPSGLWAWALLALAVLMLMTAINFTNFMDGSNGMVTIQALAAAALMMLLAAARNQWPTAWLCALLIGTLAGFLPYNLPRAKIFLGDVGSGGIGLLLGALILFGVSQGALRPVEGVLATSALWLDAGLTLAWRIASGKRWYRAHREHLFQWLIRSGWSHGAVALAYLGWTLLAATPMLVLLFLRQVGELQALLTVAGVGVATWLLARRLLLRQAAVPSHEKP
ncbi:MAG: glycosyl transferase family 4 [Lysobacteraceae bacterium]